MEELSDFKKPSVFKEYGATMICALLGAALALSLAYFISRDLRASPQKDVSPAGAATAVTDTASDTNAILADTTEDVTDLVGYTLLGERTITSEAGDTYTAEFTEAGTVAGSFVPEQMNYRVEMDDTGDMTLIFSKDDLKTSFTLSYDDSYRMILSDDAHTYTVE